MLYPQTEAGPTISIGVNDAPSQSRRPADVLKVVGLNPDLHLNYLGAIKNTGSGPAPVSSKNMGFGGRGQSWALF